MIGILILLIAFFLNCYACYLVVTDTSKRKQKRMNLKFNQEREKYLVHLTEGFGVSLYDALDEYKKIERYPDLVARNQEMERVIKMFKL